MVLDVTRPSGSRCGFIGVEVVGKGRPDWWNVRDAVSTPRVQRCLGKLQAGCRSSWCSCFDLDVLQDDVDVGGDFCNGIGSPRIGPLRYERKG